MAKAVITKTVISIKIVANEANLPGTRTPIEVIPISNITKLGLFTAGQKCATIWLSKGKIDFMPSEVDSIGGDTDMDTADKVFNALMTLTGL